MQPSRANLSFNGRFFASPTLMYSFVLQRGDVMDTLLSNASYMLLLSGFWNESEPVSTISTFASRNTRTTPWQNIEASRPHALASRTCIHPPASLLKISPRQQFMLRPAGLISWLHRTGSTASPRTRRCTTQPRGPCSGPPSTPSWRTARRISVGYAVFIFQLPSGSSLLAVGVPVNNRQSLCTLMHQHASL